MIRVFKANERGMTKLDWLMSWHSFSFGHYLDPQRMGFRSLRVINDDIVAPSSGFAPHGHRDMEILTYVLKGAVTHRDSTGGEGVIQAGEMQRMTAGTGVTHSEYNDSLDISLHLLQIWLRPNRSGLTPGYESRQFQTRHHPGELLLMAAGPERRKDDTLLIHQDASVYGAFLRNSQALAHRLEKGRGAWLQVASGELNCNGLPLSTGDGASFEDETQLQVRATADSEFLLFDLA